jgi:hypothetical protein
MMNDNQHARVWRRCVDHLGFGRGRTYIVVTMHCAAIALTHPAWAHGHVPSSPLNWVAVLSIVIAATAIVFVIAAIAARLSPPRRRGDDDDTDFGGGGGRRGPKAPNDPEGDPAWWPEFERQFAAHVARSQHRLRPLTAV